MYDFDTWSSGGSDRRIREGEERGGEYFVGPLSLKTSADFDV